MARVLVAIAGLALAGWLAACGTGPGTGPQPGTAGATGGSQPGTGAATSGPAPAASSPAPRGGCPSEATVRVAAGVVPGTVCVPVTGRLTLAADRSTDAWTALVSSNPRILSCAPGAGKSGATCLPHLPGTVTVSATGGPPQARQRWELTVNVIAYGLN